MLQMTDCALGKSGDPAVANCRSRAALPCALPLQCSINPLASPAASAEAACSPSEEHITVTDMSFWHHSFTTLMTAAAELVLACYSQLALLHRCLWMLSSNERKLLVVGDASAQAAQHAQQQHGTSWQHVTTGCPALALLLNIMAASCCPVCTVSSIC